MSKNLAIIAIALGLARAATAQSSFPIRNGVLQTPLDAAGFSISNLNLADSGIPTPTNQVITIDGQVFVITNTPASAGDVLVFDPATTTACFVAQATGLTESQVRVIDPLMTNSENVVLGAGASGSYKGCSMGFNANGSDGPYGQSIGQLARGGNQGVAIGGEASGYSQGVGIGESTIGYNHGTAVGQRSKGWVYGAALGCYAYAPNYAVALGTYSWSTNNAVALGSYVTNPIPSTTRVRGNLYLDGGTKIYTRPDFNSGEFTELATGGGAAGTFPVFHLDVGTVDGNWTDFEIKASTNNFASLCYYYKSWTNVQDATRGDTNALVYFTDDHAEDVRVWNLKPQTNAVSEMLISSNSVTQWIYFYPSHDCTIPWGDWMSSTNTALVWSWVRVDDLGFEMNVSGTKQRWNPIRPDSWEIERTTP